MHLDGELRPFTGIRSQAFRTLRKSEVRQSNNGQHSVFLAQHKTAKMAAVPLARSAP